MTAFWNDLRIAARLLLRAPGYATVATLVLALGIGICTTVYAVLDTVVLQPLPFADSERLVRIRESQVPKFPQFSVAPGNYLTWRDQATAFQGMALYTGGSVNLTGRPEPLRLRSTSATPEFFDVLGVRAALGKTFGPGEAADTTLEPVVLSHGAWRTHFGGDEKVIGRALTLNGKVYTVTGVMPPHFDYPSATTEVFTLWRTGAKEAEQYGSHYGSVVARLKPGVAIESAVAELDTIAQRLEREHPDSNTGWRTLAKPLLDDILGESRGRIELLFAGVWLVLLVACANVAGLTLARINGRAHEFAIRRAQGAANWRIARQLAAEGLLLALAGGALGLGFAAVLLPVLKVAAPEFTPRIGTLELGMGTCAFALLLALIASLAASVLPGVFAARRAIVTDLRDGGRGAGGVGKARARDALVAAEVALAIVLLAGAGLLGRSLMKLTSIDPGLAADDAVLTSVSLPSERYREDKDAARFYAAVTDRLAAAPGIQAAGVTQAFPMTSDYVNSVSFDGRPEPPPGQEPSANFYAVTPGYFAAAGIPVHRGRGFTAADRDGGARVALVSESFAAKHFPGVDPIGKRIQRGKPDEKNWREIVGVVGDVRQYGLDADMTTQMYEPFDQAPFHWAMIVMRTELPQASVAATLRSVVHELDPDQPIAKVWTVSELIGETVATRRFSTLLLVGFALGALLLSAIGLYGTIAYSVGQRTREIGVRMAMGARSGQVQASVLRSGLLIAAAGVALGAFGALAAGRLLESFVFDVSPRDPVTLVGVAVLMLAVAALASWLPAWRAARIDPMVALRHE